LDRIDIHIDALRVDYEKLSEDRMGESSESIHHHVQAARNIPLNRFSHSQTIHSHSIDNVCNADMLVGE
jgi:magnesium chelatase family protein